MQKWGGRARAEHKHLSPGSVLGQVGCLHQGRTPRASASTGAGRVGEENVTGAIKAQIHLLSLETVFKVFSIEFL